MEGSTFKYTQLDKATQLNTVRQRIRDLEAQHQQVSLRVNTPAPNDMISGQDRENVSKLEESLRKLYALEAELSE